MLAGEEVPVTVLRGAPAPGDELPTPALVELPETTVLIPPGWSGHVHATGTIVLTREQP
jgi:N-methylhydantoinase A